MFATMLATNSSQCIKIIFKPYSFNVGQTEKIYILTYVYNKFRKILAFLTNESRL